MCALIIHQKYIFLKNLLLFYIRDVWGILRYVLTDHITCFPLIKCSGKNKKENSQNIYSNVEKTVKTKKKFFFWNLSFFFQTTIWGPTGPISVFNGNKMHVKKSIVCSNNVSKVHSIQNLSIFYIGGVRGAQGRVLVFYFTLPVFH